MPLSQWLMLLGAVSLLVGIVTALISSRYTARVMGAARMGVAVLASDPDSPEWKEKQKLLKRADFCFYFGLFLTAMGIVFQTLSAIVPCCDSSGATLWSHSFSTGGETEYKTDEWSFYDSFSSEAECRKGTKFELQKLKVGINKTIPDLNRQGEYKFAVEERNDAISVTATPTTRKEGQQPEATITRFFCLPLGIDPRPKDPSTWTLWRKEVVTGGNNVDGRFWNPEQSYLTSVECERNKTFHQMIASPYNEKSEKNPVKGVHWTTYYLCQPSTVSPWGKEEK